MGEHLLCKQGVKGSNPFILSLIHIFPDILLIILLAMAIKEPLESLATKPGFGWMQDRKSTRLNSSHVKRYRMPSSA